MNFLKDAFASGANQFEQAVLNKKTSKTKDENKSRDDNQIAGHDADEFGRKRLFFEQDLVFKLYDPEDARGKREWEFYEDVKKNCPEILGTVIPNYYRYEQRQDQGASKPGDYLVMENIFKKLSGDTCLADIKIGKPITKFDRTPVPGLSSIPLIGDSINQVAKDGYARAFTPGLTREGFQLLGIKVKNTSTGAWEKYGKSLGRSDHILGVEYIIEKFLAGADAKGSAYQKKVIMHLVRDLDVIEQWMSKQTRYKFRGSSLVLAYLPPDNPNIDKLINSPMTKSKSVSAAQASGGIPLAGTDVYAPVVAPHQQLAHSQSWGVSYQNDAMMPIAGHNLDTYDQPLAVVRLIDFNNFEDKNEIDEESLMGIRNLRNKFYEQITMS